MIESEISLPNEEKHTLIKWQICVFGVCPVAGRLRRNQNEFLFCGELCVFMALTAALFLSHSDSVEY
jgi:hypothetical protein